MNRQVMKAIAFVLPSVMVMSLTIASASIINAEDAPQYGGRVVLDAVTGNISWDADVSPRAGAANDKYRNTTSAALSGFSSTSLTSVFGDRIALTGTGTLDEVDFTVFNSGSSAGALNTASFEINFFDGTTFDGIDGFITNTVTFTGGLAPGFFSIVTITGLSSLGIVLPTTDILVTQTIATRTGPASRLGVVLLDPITVGSSANTMYIDSATVGPAGFYTLGNPPINANPGYRINMTPEPGTLSLLAFSMIGLGIRRRR